jgi:hypothetical protein
MLKTVKTLIILIFLSASISFGQEKPSEKKLAFFVEEAFLNPQTGIKDFARLEKFVSDNRSLLAANETESQTQNQSGSYSPTRESLFEFLKLVEKKENLHILNFSRADLQRQIVAVDTKFDITPALISFINNKSNKNLEKLKLKLPDGKVGTINTRLFYDRQKGIKRIIKQLDKFPNQQDICTNTKECREVGIALQEFALKNGFSVIFDAGEKLPNELNEFQLNDVTSDFINEYNKSNK